jgi:hypothetical protein
MLLYILQILNSWTIIFAGCIVGIFYDNDVILIMSIITGYFFRYNAMNIKKDKINNFTNILSLFTVIILIVFSKLIGFVNNNSLYFYISVSFLVILFSLNIYFDILNVRKNFYKNKKFKLYWPDLLHVIKSHLSSKIPKLPKIKIMESINFEPKYLEEIITNLLTNIPPIYFQGLDNVLLINSSDLNRARKKTKFRSRKNFSTVDSRGLYHQKFGPHEPYIELFIDNITITHQNKIFKIPILKEVFFAHVLFHELGHHINYFFKPERENKEKIADEWAEYLTLQYITKRFWVLLLFFWSPINVYKLFYFLIDFYRIETVPNSRINVN